MSETAFVIEWHGLGNGMGDPGYSWMERAVFTSAHRAKNYAEAMKGKPLRVDSLGLGHGLREHYSIIKVPLNQKVEKVAEA